MTKHRYMVFLFLVLMATGIGVLHYVTPGDKLFLHEIYRRLGYFPIVVTAIIFGIRGGVVISILTIIAFIPHLRHFYLLNPGIYLSELPEVILYLAAGIVTGIIAGKEQRLREKYQDLSVKLERSYNRLHEETGLLIEAEEQLRASQKLSALGKLSASLAHEIKNPLAGIKGSAEILLDEFPQGHAKREFVEILLKEVGRLSTTVDEVLRFSKSKHNPSSARPRLETVETVISRVVTLLDNQFHKKNVTLVLDIPAQVGGHMIDGDKMSQVFINMLLNGCEAVGPGGSITLTVERCNRDLAIIFSDNGPGIPPEERATIFQPFYSKKEDGTGLGLTISSKIVESYGGRIVLDESPEGGACFTILLPLEI